MMIFNENKDCFLLSVINDEAKFTKFFFSYYPFLRLADENSPIPLQFKKNYR